METLSAAAGATSAGVALLGFIWLVLFGQQRNLVDMMRSRREKRDLSSLPATPAPASQPSTQPAPKSGAKPRTRNASASPPASQPPEATAAPQDTSRRSLYHRWLTLTGMLVLHSWNEGSEFLENFNVEPFPQTLPEATGCALRAFLAIPVVALLPGLLFTLMSLPYGTQSLGFEWGAGFLGIFLAAFVTEFFLLGVVSLVGLVLAIIPDESHDVLRFMHEEQEAEARARLEAERKRLFGK